MAFLPLQLQPPRAVHEQLLKQPRGSQLLGSQLLGSQLRGSQLRGSQLLLPFQPTTASHLHQTQTVAAVANRTILCLMMMILTVTQRKTIQFQRLDRLTFGATLSLWALSDMARTGTTRGTTIPSRLSDTAKEVEEQRHNVILEPKVK